MLKYYVVILVNEDDDIQLSLYNILKKFLNQYIFDMNYLIKLNIESRLYVNINQLLQLQSFFGTEFFIGRWWKPFMKKRISIDESIKILIQTSLMDSKKLFNSLGESIEKMLEIDFKSRFSDIEKLALVYYWFPLTLAANLMVISNTEEDYELFYNSFIKNIRKFYKEDKEEGKRVIKLTLELFNELSTTEDPLGFPVFYLERFFPNHFRVEQLEKQFLMDHIVLNYYSSFAVIWKEIKDIYDVDYKNKKRIDSLKEWLFTRTSFLIGFIVVMILTSLFLRGELPSMFDNFTASSDHNNEEVVDTTHTKDVIETNDTKEDYYDVSDATLSFVENHSERFAEQLRAYAIKDISEMSVEELRSDILVILVKEFGIMEEEADLISEELSQYIANEY